MKSLKRNMRRKWFRGMKLKESKRFYPKGKELFLFKAWVRQVFGK